MDCGWNENEEQIQALNWRRLFWLQGAAQNKEIKQNCYLVNLSSPEVCYLVLIPLS